MDERTSPVCASLNGTVFSVADQIAHENRASNAETIEELRRCSPWLSGGRKVGDGIGFGRGQGFVQVASRVGEQSFSQSNSPKELQRLGVGMPPYHPYCRTSIVAA